MKVQLFNVYYFIFLFLAVASYTGLYFIGRNKSEKFKKRFINVLMWVLFAQHLLKQLIPEYMARFPESIRNSTFENICAVSALVFPFINLTKNKTLKDYMYYFGVFGGMGAMLFPTEALGQPFYSLDVLRFYFAHFLIFACPLLVVHYGLHTLSLNRLWRVPICLIGTMCLILVNEVILIGIGLVDFDIQKLFSDSFRNYSFVFGPMPELKPYLGFIDALVPSFMKHGLVGEAAVYVNYWPILWVIIPGFVYLPIGAFLVSLPFTHKEVKQHLIRLKEYVVSRKNKGEEEEKEDEA